MKKIECISVFDMLKIGVGPSSSHTLGPWRAGQRWIAELKKKDTFDLVETIKVDLYGSLSLTGKGHATDIASILGLCGYDPVTMDLSMLESLITSIQEEKKILFNRELEIDFDPKTQVVFNRKFLDFHPNGIKFSAKLKNGKKTSSCFYSIGGGFVVKKERKNAKKKIENFEQFPFPIEKATELLAYCHAEGKKISEIIKNKQ